MAKLSVEISGDRFVFPAFKFLSECHAKSMVDRGNIHLPTLHEFRDASRYKGTIHDLKEGWIRLECFYSFFTGLAKDAEGTIPLFASPFKQVVLHNETTPPVDLESGNLLIYCMTQFFLSESLQWAIGEGKASCVMITDVEAFLTRMADVLVDESLQFVGVQNCIYANRPGRQIVDINPSRNSIANAFLTNPITVGFTKPVSHKNQRELRAIWRKLDGEITSSVTRDIPSVSELCIPVQFSTVDVQVLKNPPPDTQIGARIYRKSSDVSAEFRIGTPWEVCSPVVFLFPGKPAMFGFHLSGDHMEIANGDFRSCDIGILYSEIGPIFCCIPLEDVRSIEFFHS